MFYRPIAVAFMLMSCLLRAESVEKSVVQILAVGQNPSTDASSRFDHSNGSGGIGYVIPGHRILTSARELGSPSTILVRSHQSTTLFEARAVFRDTESNVALLTVSDLAFFEGIEPLAQQDVLALVQASGGAVTFPFSSGTDSPPETPATAGLSKRAQRPLAVRDWVRARSQDEAVLAENGEIGQSLPSPLALAAVAVAPPPNLTLVDFARANEASRFSRTNVNAAQVRNEYGPALRLTTVSAGDSVLILNNTTGWNLSGHGELGFAIKNNGPTAITNTWTLVNAAGKKVSIQSFLGPGSSRNFRIPLVPGTYVKSYTDSVLKGIKGAANINAMAMDLGRIVRFEVTGRLGASSLEIGNLVAKNIPMPATNPFPFVDEFGQYRYFGWDGKVENLTDLASHRERERLQLLANPKPANWNEYGGWAGGPLRTASGHFRTEKYNGKWYLVDPTGHLFFSVGVNEVHDSHSTALNQRAHFFKALPIISPDPGSIYGRFGTTWSRSYLAGGATETFSFLRHNLLQKYGSDWRNQFYNLTHPRLRSWGFNAMSTLESANPSVYQNRRFAYTMIVQTHFPVTIPGTDIAWGPFPDVHDPRFINDLVQKLTTMNTVTFAKQDPWCIGFFVDNELPWADTGWNENKLAQGALTAPATLHAKIALINQLKTKYLNNIVTLNSTWKTAFRSWDQILTNSITLTPAQATGAQPDFAAYFERTAETYFSKVRAAMREKAPLKLYLGVRISRMAATAIRVASKYCDVVSVNYYGRSPSLLLNRILPGGKTFRESAGDAPLLFSEFSSCAVDRGLPYNSGIECIDEEERANVFKEYIFDALKEPTVVGAHYFNFVDQVPTGRVWDGEARITGLIENTDQPHWHFLSTVRQLSDVMYAVRSGTVTARPPLLPMKPEPLLPPATQLRIVASPRGNGQVDLSVEPPPADPNLQYEWSITAAPVGAKPGVFSGNTRTATVIQHISGSYRYKVSLRNDSGILVGTPVLSDSVAVNITADLTPVSASPQTAKTGDLVTFQAIVRNIGTSATLRERTPTAFEIKPRTGGAAVFSGWGVVTTNVLPGGQLVLTCSQGGPLGNGRWRAVRGQYTLRLSTDDNELIPEANHANNTLSMNFDVVDVISSPRINVMPEPSGFVTLSVQNPPVGAGLTYEWSAVSAPAGAKPGDFTGNTQTAGVIQYASGSYRYQVIIRSILGTPVAPPVLSDPVTVSIAADLTPVSASPQTANTGDLVTFQAIVRNIGTAATLRERTATAFEIRPRTGGAAVFFGWGVVTTNVLPGGQLILTGDHGGPLGNGRWRAVRGQYTLRLITDDTDLIPEANHANNTLSLNFEVVDSVPSPKINVTPEPSGFVTLSVQNPPVGAGLTYEWSAVSAPAGAKPGDFTGNTQTAGVIQYASGSYRYQVIIRSILGTPVAPPVLSDPVTVSIAADLTPVSASPQTANTGDLVTFQAIVRNIGTAATLRERTATAFEIRPRTGGAAVFFGWGVVTTNVLPGGQLILTGDHGGPLGNGRWRAVRGQYTLRLITDDTDLIPEANNANNTLSLNFEVVDSVPSPKINVTPEPSGFVTLSVQNPPVGAGLTYEWSAVSAPAGAKPGDFTGNTQTAGVIQYASGSYRYQVIIRSILGTPVAPPVLSDPVTVSIAADLTPVSASPQTANTGDLVTFQAIVRNIGTAATLRERTATAFEIRPRTGGAAVFFGWGVVTTNVLPGGQLILTGDHGGPLGNGRWRAVRGQYTLRLITDDTDLIPEANHANNTYSVDFNVTD